MFRPLVGDVTRWPAASLVRYRGVFTALDNVPARRHLARCLAAAGVPMINGGTGGSTGQAQVHGAHGVTDCYECRFAAGLTYV
jgi:molybdopterin/thiamine biosynthesis adenylyltransferase